MSLAAASKLAEATKQDEQINQNQMVADTFSGDGVLKQHEERNNEAQFSYNNAPSPLVGQGDQLSF